MRTPALSGGRDTAYVHAACGLQIRSMFPLESVVRGNPSVASDLTIRAEDLGEYAELMDAAGGFSATEREVCFRASGLGIVLVRDGDSIIIDFTDKAEGAQALRLSILEPLLAIALYQRGRLVLHGSAAAVGGSAAVFVGRSGWGKSTMAAAMFRRGCRVCGDDIAVIASEGAGARLYPSFPQLKLKADAALALGYDPDALPLVYMQPDKRSVDAGRGFSVDPLPLGRVYVLSESAAERPRMELLKPQEALAELVRHSYRIEWLHSLAAPEHLRECAALAGAGVVRRLVASRRLAGLEEIAEMVEEDFNNV